MKVLLTGSSGFIGSYVYQYMQSLDNLTIFRLIRDRETVSSNDSSIIIHDIYQEIDAQKFREFDAVIHLAWDCLDDYMNVVHENKIYPTHYQFLTALIDLGVKNLTVIGTCQEYGMQEGCLNENMKARPNTSYARAKYKLNNELEKLIENTDVILKWIRVFYTYGNGQSSNSLTGQLYKALESHDKVFNMSPGDQLRDFVPVDQLAENIVAIALQNYIHGVINCCSGVPISVENFVKERIAEFGREIDLNLGYYPYPSYEPKAFWGDNSKLKTILDL